MAKILIVDDERNIIKTLSSILQDEKHLVFSALNGEKAINLLKSNDIDLVILDVWLPDLDGLELLKIMKETNPDLGVIMISGHGSIDIAVKSTHLGAFDFLEKPPSIERVLTSVNNALEQIRLKKENIHLKKKTRFDDEMIGNSLPFLEIKKIIETAGKTDARVLITGESGTGKELVAKAIYLESKRVNRPFIKVNCAAIPGELIESELFGHEKGAFTGALKQRIGKFEMADQGTIFLDEIGDMSLEAQAKVLRVLQEQQFERVGGNKTIAVNVRVIAATNFNIKEAVDRGTFREDLFYRLNVIPIHLPPLATRKEDIPLLVDYFLDKFSREYSTALKKIKPKALTFLLDYHWPGNVRELKNIIERLSVMVDEDSIDAKEVSKYFENYDYVNKRSNNISNFKKARREFEKDYIIKSLQQNDNNVANTAKILGIERTNLYRKIKLYNIDLNNL